MGHRVILSSSVLGVVLALSACGGTREPEAPSPLAATAESAVEREGPPVEPVVAEAEPPELAPAVTLTQEVSPYGHVSISVANRSEGPVRVALALVLERQDETETFAPAEDLGAFELAAVAEGPCAELLSGGELREVWRCMRSEEPGEGPAACVPAQAGRYRFVAQSCDGRSRTEGAPFAYP